MAEEFQESDVVFSDHHRRPQERACSDDHRDAAASPQQASPATRCSKARKSSRSKKKAATSLPVHIPESIFRCSDSDEQLEEEEEWDDEGMVPPHVLASRRIAGKMASSVFTGNGRKLKGRDLSKVRNSILRMTGFLET